MPRKPVHDSNPSRQRERRLLAEWLVKRYPDSPVKQNIRLGKITPRSGTAGLTQSELMGLGIIRRYADALIFRPHSLILVEASIPARPGYIAQLLLYRRLLPLTPELEEHKDSPVEMIYLHAIEDPVVTALAHEAGIMVEIYRPPWIEEYIRTLEPNKQISSVPSGLLE